MTSPMHGSIEPHWLAFSMRAVFIVLSRHSAEVGSRAERRRRRRGWIKGRSEHLAFARAN
jgi:hypothetical protein